jgi:hypothetical protein
VCVKWRGFHFSKIRSVTDVVIPHSRIMISKDGDRLFICYWYSIIGIYRELELPTSLAL